MFKILSLCKNKKEYLPVDMLPGDWFLHLLHAREGEIGYIDKIMSVYRRHQGGLWWESSQDFSLFCLKNGMKHLIFFQNVHRVFTNESPNYYVKTILPFANNLLDVFIEKKDFEQLKELLDFCPDCYAKNTNTKIKKLRKTNKRLLCVLIFFSVLLMISAYLIFNNLSMSVIPN